MMFVWMGFLKDGADPVPQEVQVETSNYLQQPYISITAAGALRDEPGNRAGMMMIFEVEDRAAAEALVENSPYLKAGLYADHRLYEFQNEVG
jgi:uncharacterized protein YciI